MTCWRSWGSAGSGAGRETRAKAWSAASSSRAVSVPGVLPMTASPLSSVTARGVSEPPSAPGVPSIARALLTPPLMTRSRALAVRIRAPGAGAPVGPRTRRRTPRSRSRRSATRPDRVLPLPRTKPLAETTTVASAVGSARRAMPSASVRDAEPWCTGRSNWVDGREKFPELTSRAIRVRVPRVRGDTQTAGLARTSAPSIG